MRPFSVLSHASLLLLIPTATMAAQTGQNWEKTYPVSAAPTLQLATGDSHLHIHACSGCTAVHVRITISGLNLSDYNLDEGQQGNTVHVSFKEKPHMGFHWTSRVSSRVDVETPPEVQLTASTGDGALAVEGLHGSLSLSSGDGSQTLQDVSGELSLHSGDGNISLQRATGTLDARTGDGHLDASGSFSSVRAHSGDGAVRISLASGSHLTAASSIQTGDGAITLQVPTSFPADMDLHTGDGRIESSLPLTVTSLSSHSNHNLQGKLDGGGSPFSIRTGDGSIHLSRS